MSNETTQPEKNEDDEVQAHGADEVLGLQKFEKKWALGNNNPAMSCSSCYGLSC